MVAEPVIERRFQSMDEETLGRMADAIEAELLRNESPARVTGGLVLPRSIRFQLAFLSDFRPERIRAAEGEITTTLGQPARVVREGEVILLEVLRAEPPPVMLDGLLKRLPAVPSGAAVLGIADDGAPLLLRLNSSDAQHALIAGPGGCGKTSLLRAVASSLALTHRPRDLRLIPVGSSLGDLRLYPHTDEMSLPLLESTIPARLRRGERLPLVVLVVDDLTVPGARALADVLRLGPCAGVHVVAASNELPLTDWSWPVRIACAGEPGYFTAESRTGAVNFTAAQVSGERRARLAEYVEREE